jgi:hypothetical protein
MGLPWVRLDSSMPDNPKILGLLTSKEGHRAAFVWICCLAYAGKHETGGFITREAVVRVNGRNADMDLLTRADFLTAAAGGWSINGWDEFQQVSPEALRRKEKAQKAAAARWSQTESRKGLKAVGNHD